MANIALVTSCSDLAVEAIDAEREGRVVNNEIMHEMYPESYKSGEPQYLERDFEAGADFICDEIRFKYGEDLCSSEIMGWREAVD